MNHTLLVYFWLWFTTPMQRIDQVRSPEALLHKLSRVSHWMHLSIWSIVAGCMVLCAWTSPIAFLFSVPIICSCGVLLTALVGTAQISKGYIMQACPELWSECDPGYWPVDCRSLIWQIDLARTLLGDANMSSLQAQALAIDLPDSQNPHQAQSRRL